jgi:signal transduction histidine kinase
MPQTEPDRELSSLRRTNQELRALNDTLRAAQNQLLQSERLASIGQLAAGVAHEINNPICYVFSNFGTLEAYLERLFEMLQAYEQAEPALSDSAIATRLAALRARVELDYLKQDIPMLMGESKEGLSRVRKIVQDLKDFSRVDTHQEWVWASLQQGIDSTLNIVANEIKYRADVRREYGALPDIECLPSELNQVFLNLLVNAAHAIGPERGLIVVRSADAGDQVWVEVEDNGSGIAPEHLPRIFDPFFTTKPVGRGTGLGLSLAYGIVQKHHGRIDVRSEPGRGTCFRITLPVRRQGVEGAAT